MSIEKSSAPASPRATASAEGAGAKGKVKAGEEGDAGTGGGFFAILSALDPKIEDSAGLGAPLAAQDILSSDVVTDAVPVTALAPSLPIEVAVPLGQAGEGGVDQLAASGLGGVRSARTAVNADMTEPANQKPLPLGSDKAQDIRQNVSDLLDQIEQGVSGRARKPQGADLRSGAAASLAESRVLYQASLTDVAAREPAISSALLASGLGEGLLRPADRPVSKTPLQLGGLGMEGNWGQSAYSTANKADAPSVLVDPSASTFEATVADTVSYWVTQGVQKAELKLDGLDGESIAVSISLKGDEAHIGFRTDKPETRQMLEGAVAHLKDLLTSEGLVLSGVSVGTSGQSSAGAQEQRNPPGARQASFVSVETAPAELPQRVNKSAARALDLYV